jgi:hypothetical protein
MKINELKEYIRLILIESRIREAEISGNRKVRWGCETHISDLEDRVSYATQWRDKYPRGSVRRYHWGSVVRQLKEELKSARRASQALQLNEKDEE